MAVPTVVAVVAQNSLRTWNILGADNDSGATASIPHGFGAIPEVVLLTPIIASAILGDWSITTIDATNLVVTKTDVAQGGDAALPVMRLTAMRAHSLIRG